jgi:hypothetical protein
MENIFIDLVIAVTCRLQQLSDPGNDTKSLSSAPVGTPNRVGFGGVGSWIYDLRHCSIAIGSYLAISNKLAK